MTVTSVEKDPAANTMTITAEYDAPIDRVWQMWENPRLLERWWGPPGYPATFIDHDLSPGGRIDYYMTTPEGDKPRGWWRVLTVDAPRGLEFELGFSDDEGKPIPGGLASTIRVALTEQAGSTRMAIETVFPSAEVMAQMITQGMDEGMSEAVGQIDDLLNAGVTS